MLSIIQLKSHPIAHAYLYLFSCQILGSPEYVALWATLTAQLMDLNHFPVRYQPNEGIWWQQAQWHL